MCLNTDWLVTEEAWKACLTLFPGDRQYAELIRTTLKGSKDGSMVFLFSLREGKVSRKVTRCESSRAESVIET